ncbi:putative dehydrogenase [Pseudomonas sp. JAI111]|nr:putative dehydrogenase [Pseudomonas sp. JAI111]
MNSPLRIALIGAGNRGQQHYPPLKSLTQVTLCAVVDPWGISPTGFGCRNKHE